MTRPGKRFVVCQASEMLPGTTRLLSADGVELGVFNLGENCFVAYRNVCPHQGAPICLGRVGGTTLPSFPTEYVFGLAGKILHCPWHGWQFNLEDGEAMGHRARLARVETALENGEVVLYL